MVFRASMIIATSVSSVPCKLSNSVERSRRQQRRAKAIMAKIYAAAFYGIEAADIADHSPRNWHGNRVAFLTVPALD